MMVTMMMPNNPKLIVRISAIVVVLLVLVVSARGFADNLDYVWGSMPNINVVRIVNMSETGILHAGEWFQVVYEIKVRKWIWESEDSVRDRVEQHFENVLGRTIREHPEVRIYYAEYRHYKTDNYGLYADYYYRARIVGHVEPLELSSSGKTTRLVGWVGVAVIIALIVAAIIATIVLVQQPAVQKLVTAVSEGVQRVSQAVTGNPIILPLLIMTGLGVIAIMATTSRPSRAR